MKCGGKCERENERRKVFNKSNKNKCSNKKNLFKKIEQAFICFKMKYYSPCNHAFLANRVSSSSSLSSSGTQASVGQTAAH